MTICYNFKSYWDSIKLQRISNLLMERIQLLLGVRTFEKIIRVCFFEKEFLNNEIRENIIILDHEKHVFLNIINVQDTEVYEVFLEKDILLLMMTPGSGQAIFDNHMINIKCNIKVK